MGPGPDVSAVAAELEQIRARIERAARAAHRDPAEITLVAVSKGQPAEALREAYAAGQRDFGENYVQEWQDKAAALADLPDIRWHFLGHLQRNKVRHVIGKVHLLHAVDDMQGMDEMARLAHASRVTQDVLLQINLGEEQQKRGCGEADADLFVQVLLRSPGLRLQGVMALPPVADDAEATRPWFARLRQLRDRLARDFGDHPNAPRKWLLSMGMSGDFEVAIAEGATHVRVGSAIFGARPPRA